jgi:PPOX class probable F420-dependent enzyme
MSDTGGPNPKVAARWRTDPIAWLGSTRSDGRPYLVPVWFLWDGETVLVFTKPDQKVRNLRQNPRVTLALDGTNGGSQVAMLDGTAELLAEPMSAIVPRAYAAKYAALLSAMNWTVDSMAAEYTQPIRITPMRFMSW